MSEILTTLRASRAEIWSQANELATRASAENRCFSDSEQRAWENLNNRLTELDERIGHATQTEQRAREADAVFRRIEAQPSALGGLYRSGSDSELRGFLRGEGSRIFEVRPEPLNIEGIQKRALFAGAATGSDTVPTSFYGQLVEHMVQTSPVLQHANVLSTNGGESLQVPKTTAHSAAGIVAEGSAITTSEPTFDQVTLGAYKYGTFLQISRELLDDTGVDLEGYLARECGRALGLALGAHTTTGTGSGQPRGYLTDATTGVTGGTGAAPTYDNLVDLFYSVIAPYRAGAVWMANDATIADLRKIKASGTGEPMLVPTATGESFTMFGRPVISDPNVPDVATGAKSLAFGDFSRYFVRMAGSLRFERDDSFAFDRDLISYRCLMRADAALVDTSGAIKVYTSA